MSHNRVNITEVARAAGVSITTVSLILNGKSDSLRISEKTKAKVFGVAAQLGYQANPFASALRKGKTGVVGVISRSIATPFLGEVARELQKAALSADTELLIASARQSFDTMKGQLNIMQNHLFDGLILLGDIPNLELVVANLRAAQKIFVSVESGTAASPPVVTVDEQRGMLLALDYLRDLGHRRIAYVGDPTRTSTRERQAAYRRYLEQNGFTFIDGYVQLYPQLEAHLPEVVLALLRLPQPPTAIFCAADGHALLLEKELLRAGIKIPQDLSVMGFDDSREAVLAHPELTTIRQPTQLLAEAAISLLLKIIETPEDVALRQTVTLIAPELIVRASTAPPSLD